MDDKVNDAFSVMDGAACFMDIIEKAQTMLEKYPLCDHCMGRQFALLGFEMENSERGRSMKVLLAMKGHNLVLSKDRKGASLLKVLATNGSFQMAIDILRKMRMRTKTRQRCFLCDNRFENLPNLVEKIVSTLSTFEYDTFLVGVKIPAEIEEREDEFRAEFGALHSENIRNEFSRVIGKMLAQVAGTSTDFLNPHVAIVVNPFTENIDLQINSLFVMGRYRKLSRGISQSKWLCNMCRGKGCKSCDWTGKTSMDSVEELVSEPILEQSGGEKALFHGAGREDRDALMLGRGRPFIVEIKRPHKRALELTKMEEAINDRAAKRIEVRELKFADREKVRKLKLMESSQKLYRITVKLDKEISDDDIKKLEKALTKITVHQQTPQRVLQRRSDVTREKDIYETGIKRLSLNSIEMRIRCQGGLYVKELVTGDDGRTSPNVSEIVGAKAEPLELDVLGILANGDDV